jgi:hypothetical protein
MSGRARMEDAMTAELGERASLVEQLLVGAVDLHCHSGPSVMPRDLDHIEALEEASAAGFRAVLFKDHYYSVTPVTNLLAKRYAHLNVVMVSGVALNNAVGGINCYAVDHTLKLGGRVIWMPTFSARNHIDEHTRDKNFHEKFPTPGKTMLSPIPLSVLDAGGRLVDEVKVVLDLIAESDAVLSAGHLHISEIWPLFEEARARGVKRLLVNHPTYVVGADHADMRTLAAAGVYMEHSMCMFIPGSKFHFWDNAALGELIEAGGVDHTILGSDLGQSGNPRPVEGFRTVIGICLDLGYAPDAIRKMISTNAANLLGLPPL